MINNIIKKITFVSLFFIIFTFFVSTPATVNAQEQEKDTYTLLAPLPCVGGNGCAGDSTITTFEKYIPGIFNIAIALSAAFAVLNLVWGGFQYLSTDALQKKSEGRSRLSHSILGLLLVIGAWLILYTINPKLLEINFSLETVTVNAPYGASGTISATPVAQVEAAVRTGCPNCEVNLSATYNLTDANIARLNCPTCVSIRNDIPIRSNNTNTNVTPELRDKLIGLKNGLSQQSVGWGLNEAFPPTVNHQDSCHYNGTCIDAGLTSTQPVNVKRFIETARNNGLRPVYEVTTEARKQTILQGLRDSGMTGDLSSVVIVVPTINNEHFSVYNQ